jgi:FAD/FMN-containing dehydrogenase
VVRAAHDANEPGELERAEAFGADILKLCVEVGGVLTGEHGGVEKRDLMPVMFSEIDMEHRQRVKCAFDEQSANILVMSVHPLVSWSGRRWPKMKGAAS